MKKKLLVLFFFLIAAVSLLALKDRYQKNSALRSESVSLQWRMHPEVIKDIKTPVEFKFYLKDKNRLPLKNARVYVEANMNHAGMIPVKTEALPEEDFYRASLLLTMHGDWILFLTITGPHGNVTNRTITFSTRPE